MRACPRCEATVPTDGKQRFVSHADPKTKTRCSASGFRPKALVGVRKP